MKLPLRLLTLAQFGALAEFRPILISVACVLFHTSLQAQEGGHLYAVSLRQEKNARGVAAILTEASKPIQLPPLTKGLTELKFGDFFVRPVGTRGLEIAEKLRQLDGQRVRILGYMVHQEEPPPGRLLLAPMPAQIHEHDNGLADDLPASTLYVSVPTLRHAQVPYVPGLMLLTGTLSVGNMTEPDGRISVARLALDPPDASIAAARGGKRLSTPSGKGAERLMSTTSRAVNVVP